MKNSTEYYLESMGYARTTLPDVEARPIPHGDDGSQPDSQPPVLLARPGYAGTVAAIRDLGRDHIPVTLLVAGLLDCARWSKHVDGSVRTGAQADPKSLLHSLQTVIESGAGHVLLPTCDTSAWTYSAFSNRLSTHFRVYAPPLETMNLLLDKPALEAACAKADIAVLDSWTVRDASELAALAADFIFPIIIKPRTHVRRMRNDKGEVVGDYTQLVEAVTRAVIRERFFDHGEIPVEGRGFHLQQFVDIREKGVLSITGFIDRSGTQFVARAARKIMLRSEPAGVGVCFESVPLDQDLAQATARLCRAIGYFGAFEFEFIWDGARWAAIDFNPRFYNQMVLDIARGMPLARLCYYDAIDDQRSLAPLVARAQTGADDRQLCLRDGFTMTLILAVRRFTGRLPGADRQRWQDWNHNNRGEMMDLIRSTDDPWVWPVHMASEIRLGLKKMLERTKARFAGTLYG